MQFGYNEVIYLLFVRQAKIVPQRDVELCGDSVNLLLRFQLLRCAHSFTSQMRSQSLDELIHVAAQ